MLSVIYKQAYNYHIKNIPINSAEIMFLSRTKISNGFIERHCEGCEGTGKCQMERKYHVLVVKVRRTYM